MRGLRPDTNGPPLYEVVALDTESAMLSGTSEVDAPPIAIKELGFSPNPTSPIYSGGTACVQRATPRRRPRPGNGREIVPGI
jgi:hypothetical protein